MNLFDQVLVKFYSLFILILSIALLILGFGLFEAEVFDFLDLLYGSVEVRLIIIILSLLLLVISLRYLFMGNRRDATPPTINQRNDLGETRISITTLENIASKAIQKVPGVQDWKVRIKASEIDGNQYFIKIIADGETAIPDITVQIQKEVKATVEAIAGIEVSKVSVLISDIATPKGPKPRRVE